MKKQIKTIILFITIFSLCFGFSVWASIESDRASEGIESAGCTLYQIVSSSPYGNYTKIVDECGNDALVNTAQWNEYQMMIQQGSPKVDAVLIGWAEDNYYVISGYQLAGQPEVKLPKESQIKIKDTYNCDQLSILKYLGNQLGSSYVFNQTKREQEMKENNARIDAERARQQAEAKADAEEIARNQEHNKQAAVTSNKDAVIPYTMDWLKNRAITVGKEISDRIYGEFDDKYDFVTKYAVAHYGSLEEMSKYNKAGYFDKDKHMGKEAGRIEVVNNILNDIKSGKATSVGDWIRKQFKENPMSSWNTLAYFVENSKDYDITVHGFRLITYKEEVQFNEEQCKYILEDMKVIANLSLVSKDEKTRMVESLMSGSTWIDGISTDDLSKQKMDNYKSSTQMKNELMNKWNTEYLPNIKE